MKQSFQEQHPTFRIIPPSKVRKRFLSLQKSSHQEASGPGTMLPLCHPYQQNGSLSRSLATKKCGDRSLQLSTLSATGQSRPVQRLPHLLGCLPASLLCPIIPFSSWFPAPITSLCSSEASDDSSSPLN